MDKVFAVYAIVGDYYVPEILYAIADSQENAEKLKAECEAKTMTRSNGTVYRQYEGAEIYEIELNEEL